jgi:hypothetical protein
MLELERERGVTDIGEVPACTAFPTGIPEAITFDRHDHRKAFRGDGGVRFEAINERAAAEVARMF